jgi:hypothetical protein
MSTLTVVLFCVAAIFYLLTWVYIRQLVRDVNNEPSEKLLSVWRWRKGWKRHRALFPTSVVRQRLMACMALTVTFGLIAFAIQARLMLLRLR